MAADFLPLEVAEGVKKILGDVRVAEELTLPWGGATRSVRVVGRGGEPSAQAGPGFVVQWSLGSTRRHRRAMSRRLRLGRDLGRLAPWLPLPEVLGGEGCGPRPFVVSRFVPGSSGRELLGDDAGAALLGTAVGVIAVGLARVPTASLRLSRTWSEPDRLGAVAERWLQAAGPFVDRTAASAIRGVIEQLPDCFAGVRPGFAHGDLAPVNVLVWDGAVVALLDLERGRLAHPLFDAAWWSRIVRYHHPERWQAASRAFLLAARIEENAVVAGRLNSLAVLQCLEALAATPAAQPRARREWANKLAAVLGWMEVARQIAPSAGARSGGVPSAGRRASG